MPDWSTLTRHSRQHITNHTRSREPQTQHTITPLERVMCCFCMNRQIKHLSLVSRYNIYCHSRTGAFSSIACHFLCIYKKWHIYMLLQNWCHFFRYRLTCLDSYIHIQLSPTHLWSKYVIGLTCSDQVTLQLMFLIWQANCCSGLLASDIWFLKQVNPAKSHTSLFEFKLTWPSILWIRSAKNLFLIFSSLSCMVEDIKVVE